MSQNTLIEKTKKAVLSQLDLWGISKVSLSFSGGRTSSVMTYLVLRALNNENIEVVTTFANTGSEHPLTLEYVNKCDIFMGARVVWLEAVTHHGVRKSCTHKIVDFETASRNGEPFEQVIKKYGIPNVKFLHCTRELKVNPMQSYLKTLGWHKGKNANYGTAIGIRSDELDRISPVYNDMKFLYPLADIGLSKASVNHFIKDYFPFDLGIPSDAYGNCVHCYKKSDRKLFTIAKNNPEFFDFPNSMESKYPEHHRKGKLLWYRKNRTTRQILEESEKPFSSYSDEELNLWGSCDQGCEVDWAMAEAYEEE